jgi:hypothetical protein
MRSGARRLQGRARLRRTGAAQITQVDPGITGTINQDTTKSIRFLTARIAKVAKGRGHQSGIPFLTAKSAKGVKGRNNESAHCRSAFSGFVESLRALGVLAVNPILHTEALSALLASWR